MMDKTVKVANNIGDKLLPKDLIRKNGKKSAGKRYSRK